MTGAPASLREAIVDAVSVYPTEGLATLCALTIMRAPREVVATVFAAALDEMSAGSPPFDPFGNIRDEAAWWADCATPPEVEAYVAAGLRRIERQDFGLAARKRLLVAFYTSLPEADRRAFLARVDPKGRFTARAVA